MSELRERMIADMTAAGFSASTKEVYLQGVRGLRVDGRELARGLGRYSPG